MDLRITRPAFTEAMARRGVDVAKAPREDMRSYVCAQCHVTYFFNPNDKNRVWFPWDNGFEPKNFYDFETNTIKLSEWTNPLTGQGMIKPRHPEFEMWQGSVHQQNGVSCADCHMPYMKQGTAKITSHWWTSPMRTYEQSCSQCHKQTEQQMRDQVIAIQDRTKAAQDRAGEANKTAVIAIQKAKDTPGVDTKLLDEAKALQRESQFYWDLVASENSMGAHNPPKIMQTLADSIDLARQAESKAIQAAAAAPKH
jgi:nitrite reductase (cytochrome c-552)